MVLPGWNVSEPVQLAVKLYKVVEALKNAPEDARAFSLKVDRFHRSLNVLLKTFEDDLENQSSPDHLDNLHATLIDCKDCVRRCEDFSRPFQDLTKDARGHRNAGQRVRLLWHEEKIAKLAAEVDDQIANINTSLLISLHQAGQSRRGSIAASPVIDFTSPSRAGTVSSLPAYSVSPPQLVQAQRQSEQQAKTPSDILGIKDNHARRLSGPELEAGSSKDIVRSEDGRERTVHIQEESPCVLRQSKVLVELPELDENLISPLESRRGKATEAAVGSPESAMSSGNSPKSSCISAQAITDPCSSSRVTSRNSSLAMSDYLNLEPDNANQPNSTVLAAVMDNLSGVKIFYKSKCCPMSCAITRIELWQDRQTMRRCFALEPPQDSNIRFFCFPRDERMVPHSEHPEAYGTNAKLKVKFIEPYPLYSQKLSESRRSSSASTTTSSPLATVSSAASIISLDNIFLPLPIANAGNLQEKAQQHEYDFEKAEDYQLFQELLMGDGAKLQAQLPFQVVTSKRYKQTRPSTESELQYLRLWQLGREQYLTFFCNMTSRTYKQYKVECFQPVESTSKKVVKLDVHMPGMTRRGSKPKSPIMSSEYPAQGLTSESDLEDLNGLDRLSIEFSSSKDKAKFLHEARFHGMQADHVIPPFSFGSRSSAA